MGLHFQLTNLKKKKQQSCALHTHWLTEILDLIIIGEKSLPSAYVPLITIIMIIKINFIYIASILLTVLGALQCIKRLKTPTITYISMKSK